MSVRKWWLCFRAYVLCLCIQLMVLLVLSTLDRKKQTDEINSRLVNYDNIQDLVFQKIGKEDTLPDHNFMKKTSHMCPQDGCPSLCINNTFKDAFYGANISNYKVCLKYSLDKPSRNNKVNAWEFMINHDHNMLWCNVFKAASSAWMYVFSRLAGYNDWIIKKAVKTDKLDLSPVILARRCYKRPSEQELISVMQSDPEPTSFMVTRHPLERLVSYYRNKYIDDNPDKYIRNECKFIKRKYKHFNPQRKFVDPGLNPSSGCGSNLPNFIQFIAHVIEKVDTMDEDGKYILHRAGIDNFISLNKQNAGKVGESKIIAESYLCQLSRNIMDQLIQVYQYDLEMFHYDVKKYIICTRDQG